MSYYGMSPNRYMCSALDEMRAQVKLLTPANMQRYISITSMLIEEIQTMGNRMEGHLEDMGDIDKMLQKRKELKNEIRDLKMKKADLELGED